MTQESDNKKPVDKRRTKELPPTKVVVRRLPPSLTAETLLEQISPLPNYDFFYFIRADLSLGTNAFSRAYINFQNYDDISNFRDKFDGYIFVDGKGNEYPAIVEFSTFQKIPKKKSRKPDSKKGTIEHDSDYVKFLDSLTNPEAEEVVSLDAYLEQLEAKEREAKATKGGPKVTTPLIEYIKKRREEKRNSILRAREERKKRDQERKQIREDERRKRKERDVERQRHKDRDRQRDREKDRVDDRKKDGPVKLLKNTERENDDDESKESATEKDTVDNKHSGNLDHDKSTDKEKDGVDNGNDKDSSKYKEDKSRLRFSKENREKVREQRGVKDRRDDRDRGRPSPAKTDRPRSSRDEPRDRDDHRDDRRPDRLRPKSYREDRERRLNRDQDYYRDERPRSGLPRREDRRYRDDYRDSNKNNSNSRDSPKSTGASVSKSERPGSKYDTRDRKPDRDSGRSDNSDKGSKSVRLEGDVGRTGSLESETCKDKEMSKPERERTKPESKSSAHDENNAERSTMDGNQSATIEKRKRKDRPERAIYDPRKAMERRQGARKDGGSKEDQSPRDSLKEGSQKDSPREGSEKDSPGEGSQKDSLKEGAQRDSPKEGSQKDSPKEGSEKDSQREGSQRDSLKEGSQRDSLKEGSQRDSPKEGSQKDSPKEGSQKDSPKEESQRDSLREGSQLTDEGTPV